MADSGGAGRRGLTPTGLYASGYHTPDHPATRSSSPGSGSFHTANPMDSERSSPATYTDQEDWEREGRDELLSVEIPSLEGEAGTLVGQLPLPHTTHSLETEGEEEVTLRHTPSPPRGMGDDSRSGGADRNWMDQPKLVPVEAETVSPCPEKRPLQDSSFRPPRNHSDRETLRETTPLLQPTPNQSSERCCSCCVLL